MEKKRKLCLSIILKSVVIFIFRNMVFLPFYDNFFRAHFYPTGWNFFLRNQTIRLKKLIEFFTKSVALQHDIGLR